MSDSEIIATGPIASLAMDILKPFGKITVAEDTSEDSLISLMTEALALVVRGVVPISGKVIQSAQRLRVVARLCRSPGLNT